MSEHTPLEELAGGWIEDRYEEHDQNLDARWQSTDGNITVTASTVESSEALYYNVSVEQYIEHGPYATTIETHNRSVSTIDEATGAAIDFMLDVNEGKHVEHCVSTELYRDEWVQFYCTNSDTLPGNIEAADIAEMINSDDVENVEFNEGAVPDGADKQVNVSIYPRHISVVEQHTDTTNDD
jgi:hypothetical protein